MSTDKSDIKEQYNTGLVVMRCRSRGAVVLLTVTARCVDSALPCVVSGSITGLGRRDHVSSAKTGAINECSRRALLFFCHISDIGAHIGWGHLISYL